MSAARDPGKPVLPRVVGGLILGFLGYAGVSSAYHGWQAPPPRLIYAHQNQTAAAYLRAAAARDAVDPKGRALAVAAIRRDPLDPRPFAYLAERARRNGRLAAEERLLAAAAERSLRLPDVLARLVDIRLARGDVSAAIEAADALWRGTPTRKAVMDFLVALAADPARRAALVRRLAADPPWRPALVRRLANERGGAASLAALLAALEGTATPPKDREVVHLIDRLVRENRIADAYALWLGTKDPAQLAHVTDLMNGDFEEAPDGTPFDWRFGRLRNAAIERAPRPDGAGSALRLTFAGGRTRFRHVSQLLYLPPGNYRLTGEARAQDLRTPLGLRWRLACVDGARGRLAETDRLRGSTEWRRFDIPFAVGPACTAQRLRLVLDAQAALDTRISGRAWYDRMRITRTRPDRPTPL